MSDSKKTNLSNGFLFSYDWLPMLNVLSGDEVKTLLIALIDRQRNGIPFPNFENDMVRVFAQMIEPTIERRLNGSKGGYKANRDTTEDTTVVTTEDTTVASRVKKSKVDNSKNIESKSTHKMKSFGEYNHVKLTEEQYNKLVTEYGESVITECIERMDGYLEQIGKPNKYKNYYAALKNWIKKDTQNKVSPMSVEDYTSGLIEGVDYI